MVDLVSKSLISITVTPLYYIYNKRRYKRVKAIWLYMLIRSRGGDVNLWGNGNKTMFWVRKTHEKRPPKRGLVVTYFLTTFGGGISRSLATKYSTSNRPTWELLSPSLLHFAR